jgi:ATP-binding cassette subfamily B protein
LLKFYYNYSGRILIDDVDIKDINTESIRKNITKVSQDMFLFPGSLKENLLTVKPDASMLEIENVIESVGLIDFVEKLPDGLDTYVGEDGVQLSGGEKQRICLAQGLLRKSKILLLDEVTANVDVISENDIKNSILNLMKTNDLTVISISHRLKFLDKTDLIFVLENGKLIEKGMYNDLIKHNRLFNMTEELKTE